MIIPDVNVLLYATIDAFPHHAQARTWWERTLSGDAAVGLAPVCALGFVRVSTSRRVFVTPMSTAAATTTVRSWLDRPNVHVLPADAEHLTSVLRLLEAVGAAGNLTTDAQIAGHALRHGATVATNDTDFARFPDVRAFNPLAG